MYAEKMPSNCIIIFYVVISTIPLSILILGLVHLNDCPMEPMIPVYMVVAGIFGFLKNLLQLAGHRCEHDESSIILNINRSAIVLITLFNYCWHIVCSVIFFRVVKIWWSSAVEPHKLCHRGTYLYGLTLLILFWVAFPCQIASSYYDLKRYHLSQDDRIRNINV